MVVLIAIVLTRGSKRPQERQFYTPQGFRHLETGQSLERFGFQLVRYYLKNQSITFRRMLHGSSTFGLGGGSMTKYNPRTANRPFE